MPVLTFDGAVSTTVISTGLDGLAAQAYPSLANCVEIDNSVGPRYLYGAAVLTLGGSFTAEAGSPFVPIFIIPAWDGSNYASPPTTNGAVPGGYWASNITANPSATFLRGATQPAFDLPGPIKFKVTLQHRLHSSAGFPANGNTLVLYRWGVRSD